MKPIFAILLFLPPIYSFASCDQEYAKNAISEEISLRHVSRQWIIEASQFTEKYYYKRTPFSKSFKTPEQLACSMKRSIAVGIAVRTSMNIVEDCEQNVEKWREDAQSFRQDSQKMASIWEDVYAQCAKVSDKDLRVKVKRYYDQRDSSLLMDHLLNEQVAPLEKKCLEEKQFLQAAIAAKDKQQSCE